MLHRRSRRLAVVFERQDVLEALSCFRSIMRSRIAQITSSTRLMGSVPNVALWSASDDDLMRADPVHAVEHSVGLAVGIAFDHERGKLLGTTRSRHPENLRSARTPAS